MSPRFLQRLCVMAALGAAAASCTQQGNTAAAARSSSPLVASVNGVAITEAEVQQGLKVVSHGGEPSSPERRKAVIAGLIRDELLRQKAAELGLEPEGAAAEEVARLELQLNAARRKALAEAWFNKQVLKKAEPTEAEARQYFEANAAMIRSEFTLQQLFVRDEAVLLNAQRELEQGLTFEEVARHVYPNLPEGVGKPWELGTLSWRQLPEPWRPVLETLQPGHTSSILRGPGGRFWIIKLLERRARPEVTFEEVRTLVVEDLKRGRLDQLSAQAEQELRRAARIVEP